LFSLQIEITVYFATKSIDEFLKLQQQANLEVITAIKESGADLALPSSSVLVSNPVSLISSSVTNLDEGYIGISISFDILPRFLLLLLEKHTNIE
jgi:predicted mannosyl-3-phosphoglycerate phosphatase (HAD superfamily)